MNVNTAWLLPLLAYFIGSIPIGWIVGKLFYNLDIRRSGSGNIGATNALRVFGTKVGILVLLLDMGKGFLATWLAQAMLPAGSPIIPLCALVVILGHVFSLFLSFRGGKGVATAAGAFLALAPLSLLAALIVFIIVVALSRYVSLGSMIAALAFLGFSVARLMRSGTSDYATLGLFTLVVWVIIYMHRGNLKRLLEGTEHRVVFTRKGNR